MTGGSDVWDDWCVRRVRRLLDQTCETTGGSDVWDDCWVRRVRRLVGQTCETTCGSDVWDDWWIICLRWLVGQTCETTVGPDVWDDLPITGCLSNHRITVKKPGKKELIEWNSTTFSPFDCIKLYNCYESCGACPLQAIIIATLGMLSICNEKPQLKSRTCSNIMSFLKQPKTFRMRSCRAWWSWRRRRASDRRRWRRASCSTRSCCWRSVAARSSRRRQRRRCQRRLQRHRHRHRQQLHSMHARLSCDVD